MTLVLDPPSRPSSVVAPAYDVFITHGDDDAGWCDAYLIAPLRECGVRVTHPGDFLGVPWAKAIEAATQRSRYVMLVLTEGWLRDRWATFAGLVAESKVSGRVIPLVREKCQVPDLAKRWVGIDYTDADRRPDEFNRLVALFRGRAGNAEATDVAVRGLASLSDLMRRPAVRKAVAKFEDTFTRSVGQTDALDRYKKLHDQFQKVETAVKLLQEVAPPADGSRPLTDGQVEAAHTLVSHLDQLLAQARQSAQPLGEEFPWQARAQDIRDRLSQAAGDEDAAQVPGPRDRLTKLLGTEPSRINSAIVRGARAVSLDGVAAGLEQVAQDVTGSSAGDDDHDRLRAFADSVAAVRRLGGSLRVQVTNHNWLQELDDVLRTVGGGVRPLAVADVEAVWDDVRTGAAKLTPLAGDRALPALRDLADRVTASLPGAVADPAGPPGRQTIKLFREFRRDAFTAFNQADFDLLTLCEQLTRVGGALREAVRRMQDYA